MVVGDTEILSGAAQVVLVFPVSGFLGGSGIGEGLPLAVYLNGNGVFVQHFIQGFLRLCGRCRRLRLIGPQGLDNHIIRQMVLVTGIDSHSLGVISRGFGSRFGAFLPKAVQLTGVQPSQQRRNLVPTEGQHGQTLFVCAQHFQFDAFRSGAVVGSITGLQFHRFHDIGIGPAQPQGNLAVGLAGTKQFGKLCFFLLANQPMRQHIPQILIGFVGVNRQDFRIKAVAFVCPQKLLELFPALGTVDGVAHAGGKQLHRLIPQLRDLVGAVIQIDNITHMIGQDCRIVRSSFPECATSRSVFLI